MQTELNLPAGTLDGTLQPCDLVKALEVNARFHRDTRFGGVFHPGRISYREITPTDSLHIVIHGDQISAHLDDISPLRPRRDGSYHYAWGPVLAHNLMVVIGDAARRVRGQHGTQRCNLRCEAEWYDDIVTDGDTSLVTADCTGATAGE